MIIIHLGNELRYSFITLSFIAKTWQHCFERQSIGSIAILDGYIKHLFTRYLPYSGNYTVFVQDFHLSDATKCKIIQIQTFLPVKLQSARWVQLSQNLMTFLSVLFNVFKCPINFQIELVIFIVQSTYYIDISYI